MTIAGLKSMGFFHAAVMAVAGESTLVSANDTTAKARSPYSQS